MSTVQYRDSMIVTVTVPGQYSSSAGRQTLAHDPPGGNFKLKFCSELNLHAAGAAVTQRIQLKPFSCQ